MIWLNGHKFVVTSNLQLALRHIRDCDSEVLIWIDAICINQKNLDERIHQILQMRDIYAGAKEVLAWIGQQ
ncbi:heterokaryon incompatibility [Tricladium varicosporioides]|nr:heterokaryon incompatibility [Hymenoscyphus varicosporioides]